MAGDSRTKMVQSAAALIGAHGVNATSFSEVVAASGAPRGSIYHHFPDGKEQLARDAVAWTSEQILVHIAACPGTTPVEVVDWFVDLFRQVAEASAGAAGCAVTGVAVDNDADADILADVREASTAWTSALADRLRRAGLPAPQSGRVALTAVAAMEGALLLCRAQGSAAPLLTVGAELRRLVPAPATGSIGPPRIRRRGPG